jgi:hypothetical protein
MQSLTEDPAFLVTTFVVIDFEATTPAGHPAQPIEVAALALRYRQIARAWLGVSASLIRPPARMPPRRHTTHGANRWQWESYHQALPSVPIDKGHPAV